MHVFLYPVVSFGAFWCFTGRVLWTLTTSFQRSLAWLINLRNASGRFRAASARSRLWRQMYEIGTQSVPVVMITGAFVGMTLAVQGFNQFKGIGLQDRMGGIINISIVRELGPVLAAIMLAGRVGGAMTAELGTMHITEQIDAVRAMGADPVRYLVLPRFSACVLLTPLLTIYAILLGVLGGYLILVGTFDVNSEAYWRFTAEVVDGWDLFVGLFKSVFFGASIALISCFKGFHSGRGARGVGQACTEAFVYSFLAILVIDFILAVIFKSIAETLWGVDMLL